MQQILANWISASHTFHQNDISANAEYNKTGNVVQHNTDSCSRNHGCHATAINIKYSECVCGLSYPACKSPIPCAALGLCCKLWHAWLYHIIPNSQQKEAVLLVQCNGTHNIVFFFNCLINIKFVFWFSVQNFGWKVSRSKNNSVRYCHKCA